MKTAFLTSVLLIGLSTSGYAQGTISFDNLGNTGGPTATGGGLVYWDSSTLWTSPALNWTLLGGSSPGSLAPVASRVGANAASIVAPGQFLDVTGSTYVIPGVPAGGSVWLLIQFWPGPYSSYVAAIAGGAYVASSAPFQNPTGGGGSPPSLPVNMVGMPSIVFVPEPNATALLGLGMLGVLLFRRKIVDPTATSTQRFYRIRQW